MNLPVFVRLPCAVLLSLFTGAALAADPGAEPAAAAPDLWKIAAGPGVFIAPKFPGARQEKSVPLPALSISWDDRIFTEGPDLIGFNLLRSPDNYHLGLVLGYDFQSRKASDDARLRGLGDVKLRPKLKTYGDYSYSFLTGSFTVYQDIFGLHQGRSLALDLAINIPVGEEWIFSFGPGITRGNKDYVQTLFGVTPQQALASGLPAYNAPAGQVDAHFSALAIYNFNKRWSTLLSFTEAKFKHGAAASPVIEKRSSLTTFASLSYHF